MYIIFEQIKITPGRENNLLNYKTILFLYINF